MAERYPTRGASGGKSGTAFRTIGEVAAELDVPQHVLRFWESKFPQLSPLKRDGGRRHYRPEDIDLLRGIRELLYTEGYTIKGVQKRLRASGAKAEVAELGAETGAAEGLSGETRAALEDLRAELEGIRDLLKDAKT